MKTGLISGIVLLLLVSAANPQSSEIRQGDLDASGVIDSVDLVILANHLAGNLATIPAQFGQVYAIDPMVGTLRLVPSGLYTQGSPADEPCRSEHEAQFVHALGLDIAVMATEVTRQMWADLSALQPTLPADPTNAAYGSGMTNPVQSVTWHEAVLFANLLSVQQGLTPCYYTDASFTTRITSSNHTTGPWFCDWNADGYRLPTEGEWEYFCRAGTTGAFSVTEPDYSADNCGTYTTTPGTWPVVESVAWFCANRYDAMGNNTTKPVASLAPNPAGLYDAHGNVYEWCWDWYGAYPAGSASDYRGSDSGTSRVVRGGCWHDYILQCRSAHRTVGAPDGRGFNLGFRLVRAAP